jgi:hypothetical protein
VILRGSIRHRLDNRKSAPPRRGALAAQLYAARVFAAAGWAAHRWSVGPGAPQTCWLRGFKQQVSYWFVTMRSEVG